MKPIVIIVSAFLLVQGIFAQEREAKIIFLDSTSIKGYGEIKKDKIYFRVDQKSESTEGCKSGTYSSCKSRYFI